MGYPREVDQVRVTGPLEPYVGVFQDRLERFGYAPWTMVVQYRLMSHLSRWMEQHRLGAGDLTGERVEGFLAAQRAGGYGHPCTVKGLEQVLGALREAGAAPQPVAVVPGSARERLLSGFLMFLMSERGLAASTARAYVARADRFLGWVAPDGDLSGLTATEVSGAVLRESGSLSVGAVQFFAAGLRAFLRYALVEGLVGSDLSPAALSATGRRHDGLPRGIDPQDARLVLAACDRGSGMGRRDYAVIVTVMRLGLRASEVANLCLDDIDWRSGLVAVSGKGHQREALPLPVEVGQAIAEYLADRRPATSSRAVFLRHVAPIGPLGRGGIGCILRRACVRAGVPPVGPHRARHGLATGMINSGVGLPGIAAVLRHHSLTSTAIYARVDVAGLRELAQPWPIEVTR